MADDPDDIVQKVQIEVEDQIEGLTELQNATQRGVEALVQIIADKFSGISNSGKEAFAEVADSAQKSFSAVQQIIAANTNTDFFATLKDSFNDIEANIQRLGPEIKSPFEILKESASKAFEEIRKGFTEGGFTEGFSKIKEAGAQVFTAIKDIGSGALKELATAVEANVGAIRTALAIAGGVVAAFAIALGFAAKSAFDAVESSSKAIEALANLGERTRTSVTDITALEHAFGQAGVSAKEFERSFEHLSGVVTKTWESIRKDSVEGADKLEQSLIAAAAASKRLQDAEAARSGDAENQSENDRAVAESRAKDLQVRQAQLALNEAERKAREAERNDLDQITKSVQSLANGNKSALNDFNATAENVIKGVVNNSREAGLSLKDLGENFAAFAAKTPQVKDVLTELGRVIGNIEDPALRNAVAVQALGRNAQSFLAALETGKIDEFAERIRLMGGAISETQKKIAIDFNSALTALGDTVSGVSGAFVEAFGPGFTDILKSLNDAFSGSQDAWKAFAKDLAAVVIPIVKGVIEVFTSTINVVNGLISTLRTGVEVLQSVGKGWEERAAAAERFLKTLRAVDDLTASNPAQRKQGLDELNAIEEKRAKEKEARDAKELANTKSNLQEEKRLQQDVERTTSPSSTGRLTDTQLNDLNRQRGIEPTQKIPAEPEQATSVADTIKNFFDTVGEKVLQGLAVTKAGADELSPDQLAQQKQQQTTAIDKLIESIGSLVTKQGEALKVQGPDAASGIGIRGEAVGEELEKVDTAATELAPSLENTANSASTLNDAFQQLAEAAQAAAAAQQQAAASGGGDGGSTVEASSGGLIRGPGTGTSDSIPAWVSNEEFIHSAAATRFWGVDFMHAINKMQMPKFSAGGLVGLLSPQLPRFAGGGVVSTGTSPLQHLGTVDLRTDHGQVRVHTDRDALSQLRRAAVQRNMGASPKPSWVK